MGGTSLWLKPQMAWPSAQHGTAGLKGYRPSRRPLSWKGGGVDMEKETLINYRKVGLYLDIRIVYIDIDGCRKSLFETAKNNGRPVPKHATYGASSAPWGTHAKQENPSRIRARGLCHASVHGYRKSFFETAKNNRRPVPKHATYGPSSAPWGTHAKQANPSRIRARGLCHASIDRCRKSFVETAKNNRRPVPKHATYGPSSAPWGTHAKQGNPSRIRARGLCHASVDGGRKSFFETAKNNRRPVPKHATYGPSSAPWGTHAKQANPSRIRARGLCHSSVDGCRKRLFETTKNNIRTVPKH